MTSSLHRQAAERYASDYGDVAERYAAVLEPTLAPVALRVVELAGVNEGQRVLDLASGTGGVARAAATRGASVVGVDISPGMVDVARAHSPAAIEFIVADAAVLPFERRSFDAVTCAFGLSHMPDVPAVLREVRRVLRPGGCLVEAAWGSGARAPAFAAALDTLGRAVSSIHAFAGILDESTWADAEQARNVLVAAGFSDVATVTEPLAGRFADAAAALAWTLAWPDYGRTVHELVDEARADFERDARQAIHDVADFTWEFAITYLVARAEVQAGST